MSPQDNGSAEERRKAELSEAYAQGQRDLVEKIRRRVTLIERILARAWLVWLDGILGKGHDQES